MWVLFLGCDFFSRFGPKEIKQIKSSQGSQLCAPSLNGSLTGVEGPYSVQIPGWCYSTFSTKPSHAYSHLYCFLPQSPLPWENHLQFRATGNRT